MHTFFLSYAGTDREIASKIVQGLEATGVKIFYDQKDIGWGDHWIQTLQDHLTECTGVIILFGQSGIRKWVKFEVSIAIKRHVEQDMPIFSLLLPGVTPEALPPFLATLQTKTLPDDLREVDYLNLAQSLSGREQPQSATQSPAVPSNVCPFPGLEAFGEAQAQFFFGRQKEIIEAVTKLGLGVDGIYRRWLQVEGTSGVGKSSLVQAGVLPAIKKGWAGTRDASTWTQWQVLEPMRPGEDPILNLADVLTQGLSQNNTSLTIEGIHRSLQADALALKVQLRGWVPRGQALVLVVDQLEELFTLTTDLKQRAHFDALLAYALDDRDGPLHLITTIRTDFMVQIDAVPALQALLHEKAGRYHLTPIGEHGLYDVVLTPAKLAGLQWSDAELPKEIVQLASGEPGALPLVENLLRLLWEECRRGDGQTLSRTVYTENLGGVGGALAKSADALLNSLGHGKAKALQMLLAMVNVGSTSQDTPDSKRRISKAMAIEAAGGGPEAADILNQLSGLRGKHTDGRNLARPRLVVVSEGREQGKKTVLVDLAHETLLRSNRKKEPYWPTFREAIDTQRRRLENRQLAEALAKEWMDNGRQRWRGLATWGQIKVFRSLSGLSQSAKDYIRASRRGQLIKALAIVYLIAGLTMTATTMAQHDLTFRNMGWLLMARLHLIEILEPEMVKIPGGAFQQGDDPQASERPAHRVTVKPFQLGIHEVTFDEYEQFVKLTGQRRLDDMGWGRSRRPAINVTWDEATAYAKWLSRLTGKSYRLPTESEWEYAARGGEKQNVWAGTSDFSQLGLYAIYDENSARMTAEVGSKAPNEFGLFDMSGNVSEWVEDCWHRNYEGAPTDGSAWLEDGNGICRRRVMRGGSFYLGLIGLRGSHRTYTRTDDRHPSLGFRLAQDIP